MARNPLKFRVAFSTPWFNIEETIPEAAGELPYYRMTSADGVIVLPFTEDGRVILVKQFRHVLERETLEVPAGEMDQGENILDAARREVAEETGYICGEIVTIAPGRFHINRIGSILHFCLAFDAVPSGQPEQGMETIIVSRQEFARLMATNHIEQTAASCFLGLVQVKFGLDLLNESIERIRKVVKEHDANSND